MYGNPQKRGDAQTQELRKEAGRWLRQLREARGLSQRDLATMVGTEYYTFISQLETGRGRIPPDRYIIWAQALAIDPREFVLRLMRYYDPVTYDIVFGQGGEPTEAPPVETGKGGKSPAAIFRLR